MNMIDRHVAHDEDKSYPWHERTIHVRSNEVRPSRAYEKRADARPKVEQANQVEERDPRHRSEAVTMT